MARLSSVFLSLLLIAGILAAGCTDEGTAGTGPAADGGGAGPGDNYPAAPVLQGTGDVSGQGTPFGTIDTLTFTVALAPGARSADMEKLVIIYADVVHSETLPPVEGWFGDPPQGSWGILRVENEVGKPNNRLEYNERCVLRVNPRVPIVPGQLISIIVKPSEGSPVTLRRVAPSTIVKENILSTL